VEVTIFGRPDTNNIRLARLRLGSAKDDGTMDKVTSAQMSIPVLEPVLAAAVAVGALTSAVKWWGRDVPNPTLNSQGFEAPRTTRIVALSAEASVVTSVGVTFGAIGYGLLDISTALGHHPLGLTIGVIGVILFIATLCCAALTVSINSSGKPQRFVPPKLRGRNH
jgi:hypothetical protein